MPIPQNRPKSKRQLGGMGKPPQTIVLFHKNLYGRLNRANPFQEVTDGISITWKTLGQAIAQSVYAVGNDQGCAVSGQRTSWKSPTGTSSTSLRDRVLRISHPWDRLWFAGLPSREARPQSSRLLGDRLSLRHQRCRFVRGPGPCVRHARTGRPPSALQGLIR